MTKKNFRSEIHKHRPDVTAEIDNNQLKRQLAKALRALRKEMSMTQKEITHRSGLTQPMVSKLESPTGSLPNWETVTRYVEACGGHMLVGFSGHEFDPAAFVDSKTDGNDILTAIAV